jgi:predicted nucleotidyltransferase
MKSKEEDVLKLFYNSGKHWHFEELLKVAGISRRQLTNWLKRFEKEELIIKVKEKGRHPFYTHNFHNVRFQNRKRIYALEMLTRSGFFDHLSSLKGAKVVILFGSFSRADWYEDSDIDIFIYGDDSLFEKGKYERLLLKDIQVFNSKDNKGLQRYDQMLPAIISGNFIKGSFRDLGVVINAKG